MPDDSGLNGACVQMFFIRGGKLIGQNHFLVEGTDEQSQNEVVQEFVKHLQREVMREAATLLSTLDLPPPVVLPLERFAEGLELFTSRRALKVVFTP